MTPFRALLGLACALALAGLAPAAQATQTLGVVGISGQLSDASGNIYTLDGGTNYFGLGGSNTLSFTNVNLNLTHNEQLVIIDGGVVDNSHIITFRLLSYPSDPFQGNPGGFTLTGRDSHGNPNGVDHVINGGGSSWQANNNNDFWNIGFVTLNFPTVTDFTLNFDVPEPSTWALMMVGIAAVGLALRRRRTAAAVLLTASD